MNSFEFEGLFGWSEKGLAGKRHRWNPKAWVGVRRSSRTRIAPPSYGIFPKDRPWWNSGGLCIESPESHGQEPRIWIKTLKKNWGFFLVNAMVVVFKESKKSHLNQERKQHCHMDTNVTLL